MEYIIVFIILLLLEMGYFKVARKIGAIDRPNKRSSHTRPTLLGGGVVFCFGALVFMILNNFSCLWFFVGLMVVSAVSFADDLRQMPIWSRLGAQLLAVILVLRQLLPMSEGIDFGFLNILMIFVVALCSIFFLNAYNFMDGINGMTGAYTIAVVLPLWIVARETGYENIDLIILTGISALIFCIFNFRQKALCFAGDVGAVSVACIVLFVWGDLTLRTGNLWHIVFFLVYLMDAGFTLLYRLLQGEKIWRPHRKHAYQMMANELGLPHTTVSGVYAALQLAISLAAISITSGKWLFVAIITAALALSYIVFKASISRYLYTQKVKDVQ